MRPSSSGSSTSCWTFSLVPGRSPVSASGASAADLHTPTVHDRVGPGDRLAAMTASSAPAGSLGVLLIEDDDDDALIVEDLLTASASDVHLSRGRTLSEGLDMLADGVDCVVLDLRLPDAAGMEAVHRLRQAAPWIAVIILTGPIVIQAGED